MDPIWSVRVGPGYSGPTVALGKVYVTDRLLEPVPVERVLCFDENTGNPLWEHSYESVYRGVGYPAGPRASVVINEDRAYALGTMGHFFCLDTETGSVLWEKDLDKEYTIHMPTWGIASIPLVVDEKIIVHVSGSNNACVVAFDKRTGKELWRNLNDRAGYASPVLIEKSGTRVIVTRLCF